MATYSQLAKHLFLSVRRCEVLVSEGVLPRQADGKGFDLDECRKLYIEHLRDRATGKLDRPRDSIEVERVRLLRAQAIRAEREELESAGLLVRKDETLRAWVGTILNAKGKLLAMPTYAARVVPADSRQAVLTAVQSLVDETLKELAGLGAALPRRGSGRMGRGSSVALHADAETVGGRMDATEVSHKRRGKS